MTDPGPGPGAATLLLKRIAAGDTQASDELYALVHDELLRIARAHMRGQLEAHTLQATALVNEAWLRLRQPEGAEWDGREHFLSVASRAMRSVLIDHARRRRAEKRGGERERLPLDAVMDHHEERRVDLVALDDALRRLADLDERQARVVELHTFGGLTMPEAAGVLGVSLATAERSMRAARAWLRAELGA
jgi:RNA polymerase sigma factor (TIGR02999 family)